jgi:hypothetical protein
MKTPECTRGPWNKFKKIDFIFPAAASGQINPLKKFQLVNLHYTFCGEQSDQ